nr:hypothetical protein [Mammaliicoccus sp. Marseille-Q6498]
MRQIISFFKFNFKTITKDKITFAWTLFFPIFLILINLPVYQESIKSLDDKHMLLGTFWSFMTILILLNGMAVEIGNIRELGALKSYVMLAGSKYPFIIGIMLTQILIIFFSIEVVTILLSLLLHIFSLKLLLYAHIYTILIVPVSIIFLVVTLLPFKASSVATISTIISIALFYYLDSSLFGLEWINPLYFLKELGLFIINDFSHFSMMILFIYLLYFVIGFIALVKLDINSKTIR